MRFVSISDDLALNIDGKDIPIQTKCFLLIISSKLLAQPCKTLSCQACSCKTKTRDLLGEVRLERRKGPLLREGHSEGGYLDAESEGFREVIE